MEIMFVGWVYVVYQDIDEISVAPEHLVPDECKDFVYARCDLRSDAEKYANEIRAVQVTSCTA